MLYDHRGTPSFLRMVTAQRCIAPAMWLLTMQVGDFAGTVKLLVESQEEGWLAKVMVPAKGQELQVGPGAALVLGMSGLAASWACGCLAGVCACFSPESHGLGETHGLSLELCIPAWLQPCSHPSCLMHLPAPLRSTCESAQMALRSHPCRWACP